jgi:hypothetical protein
MVERADYSSSSVLVLDETVNFEWLNCPIPAAADQSSVTVTPPAGFCYLVRDLDFLCTGILSFNQQFRIGNVGFAVNTVADVFSAAPTVTLLYRKGEQTNWDLATSRPNSAAAILTIPSRMFATVANPLIFTQICMGQNIPAGGFIRMIVEKRRVV